ncbi:protein-glutamate O-methyltransferase CheR [Simiduia sp. 21SJ11W-1]|uniref:CheR family methyltransferase n=1 Tax=Simiduia sp. 21SJ11W-1 TaxID=2909669 RepID=UPI0020A0CF2D|nr:CheR family methyltransferase [Simiduia sp. 21SJ11W-1]UTA48233.1 protein-glutamate O-methyltransferase CheR [Simiduia sp. 21SJ11W-1]
MVWSLRALPELTDNEFQQWSKLLEDRTGIQIAPHQRAFLQTQIAGRMRELECGDYTSYMKQVREGLQGMVEWSVLVDRLVVKETSFFRHRPSIEYVRRLVQARINNQTLNDSFDVWSVGCATGEEPYALAMVVNDCFELAAIDPYFGVTATDISMPSLHKARAGIYPARKVDQATPQERARYFASAGANLQVVEKIRDRVCFTHGNVLDLGKMPAVPMDVIFCQNVLIYFRRWRRREILNQLVDRLKPNGVLIVGLGEVTDWNHPKMKRVGGEEIQAYQRSAPGTAKSA